MRPHFILSAAAMAAALGAQDCPRPQTQLSTGTVTTSVAGFTAWKVASPKQDLAGNTALGLAPTARVVYAAYVDDVDADLANDIVVRRSTDGGYTFEPAVKVWSTTDGAFDGASLRLVADGHRVFVAFESTGGAVAAAIYQWVVGSADQGQTWQSISVSEGITAALSSGDRLRNVSNPGQIAASRGVCHVAFNAGYELAVGTGAASNNEDTYYQAVTFDASGTLVRVLPEEVRMESYPTGTADSDDPWISADGDLVAISWQDISGGGSNTTGNDSYTRISLDGGASFGPAVNHTNFNGTGSGIDTGFTKVEVEGALVVVLFQGGLPSTIGGTGDRLFAAISQDSGATFTRVEVSLGLNDTDDNILVVRNGRILIGYEEDRTGRDEIYVVVDQNGGADLLSGVVTSDILITSGTAATDQEMYFADASGDVLAVSYEPELGFGEGAGFSFSTDGGLTWERCVAQPNGDVDDLDIAVTINGDITAIYQYDAGLGNNFNNVYVAGAKAQRLVDNNGSIDYVGGVSTDVGDFVIVLGSLVPPVSNGTQIPSGVAAEIGVAYNFSLDLLSEATLQAGAPLFQGTVGVDGTATFPIPNLAGLLGQPIYLTAITADGFAGFLTRGFTDPIIQR